MKRHDDLGIDPKTGAHDKSLTTAENRFLGLLWTDHVGAENAVSADELAVRYRWAMTGKPQGSAEDLDEEIEYLTSRELDELKREVRYMHNHLLIFHDKIPLLSRAGIGGGYWIAASKEEAVGFYNTFRARAMTGLRKAARGNRAALVEMVQQLTFEFEHPVDLTYQGNLPRPTPAGPTPAIDMVDAFLAKMLEDPERYAEDLRKLGSKYATVLLPRAQVDQMNLKVKELQEIVARISGTAVVDGCRC